MELNSDHYNLKNVSYNYTRYVVFPAYEFIDCLKCNIMVLPYSERLLCLYDLWVKYQCSKPYTRKKEIGNGSAGFKRKFGS